MTSRYTRRVRSIRAEYFLSFAVMGSLLPYLPVFLAARGLSDAQIGQVLALTGLAVLVTPAIVAALAWPRLCCLWSSFFIFAGTRRRDSALLQRC